LQQKEPWLLIIDNADDRSLKLPRLFPTGGSAHILVTTRVRDFSREGTLGSLELKGLKEAEALQLLLTKADIPRPWDSSTTKTASLIAKALGYLALALIQAGTCVYRGVCELGGYLEIHSVAKRRQRKHKKPESHNDPISDVIEVVYSTFDVSLGVLEQHESVQSQDATELLKMIAFFHFEFIPLELFSRAVSSPDNAPSSGVSESWASSLANGLLRRLEPPTPLPSFLKAKDREVGKQRIRFALADLQSLSFIRLDGKYISLHPLIHSWARDSLTTTQSPLWASIALHTIMRAISLPPASDTKKDGEFHRDILPHLEACLAVTGNPISQEKRAAGRFRLRVAMFLQPTLLIIIRDQVRMHAKCGWVFAERGHFDKAAVHLQIVREMLVKLAGVDDEKTMNATLGLAGVLWGLGRLEEGINLGRSVVETRTRIYGPMDERTLSSMNKLGQSYWLNGQYREALELQEITSQRMKEVLGESHPATLEALDNLGVTLSAWHRFQESHDVHRLVLDARLGSFGPTHLDTLTTKCNLAMALLDLGRLDESKAAMTEVYTQRQTQLGKEHPWTLWALSYLSKIHIHLGQLADAEAMLTWGLEAATRSLGKDHLGVLMGRGHLAHIYARTDRLAQAERLTLDTVERVERSRGVAHPDCVYALWRLARLYVLRGARAKAVETCELGLQRAEMRISREHPLAQQIERLREGLRDPLATAEELLGLSEGNFGTPLIGGAAEGGENNTKGKFGSPQFEVKDWTGAGGAEGGFRVGSLKLGGRIATW
jgi:tetratricopeptide (TPR) repeat protein